MELSRKVTKSNSLIKNIVMGVLLVVVPSLLFSQEDGIPKEKYEINGLFKNEIGPGLLGTTGLAGIQLTHYFNSHMATEIGVGFSGAGLKMPIYPWEIDRGKFKFYTGVAGVYYFSNFTEDYSLYCPFGITNFSSNRWNFSLDMGPAYLNDVTNSFDGGRLYFAGAFKVGYRVSFYRYKKRKKYISVEPEVEE